MKPDMKSTESNRPNFLVPQLQVNQPIRAVSAQNASKFS